MEVSLLFIADYAVAGVDGKLSAIGLFNRILAVDFPATHMELYLLVQISAPPDDYGKEFQLTINLLNEKAQAIATIQAGGIVPTAEQSRNVTLNNVFKLVGLVFPEPGRYEFVILINNIVQRSLELELAKLPPIQLES